MRIEWTAPAVEDLQGIVDYIARDSTVYAEAMAGRIIRAGDRLAFFPKQGRVVPEGGDPSVREIIVQPYRVLYRLKRDRVQILAVIHGGRDIAQAKPKPWDIA